MWDKMMEETRLTVNRMGLRDKMVWVSRRKRNKMLEEMILELICTMAVRRNELGTEMTGNKKRPHRKGVAVL